MNRSCSSKLIIWAINESNNDRTFQVHVCTGHVDISLFYCDLVLVHTYASFPKDDILYEETLDAS